MAGIKNADLLALRDYVTYDSGFSNKAETTVLLNVTHSNLKAMFMELRFDLHVRFSVCTRLCGRERVTQEAVELQSNSWPCREQSKSCQVRLIQAQYSRNRRHFEHLRR